MGVPGGAKHVVAAMFWRVVKDFSEVPAYAIPVQIALPAYAIPIQIAVPHIAAIAVPITVPHIAISVLSKTSVRYQPTLSQDCTRRSSIRYLSTAHRTAISVPHAAALGSIGLRACYAMPGTDIAYGAPEGQRSLVGNSPDLPTPCYACSGTDIAYGIVLRRAVRCPPTAVPAVADHRLILRLTIGYFATAHHRLWCYG
eukprot:2150807-Rhodomonas_salina.8